MTDFTCLDLVDGYTTTVSNKPVVYRSVELRETNVADEDAAIEAASRPVKTPEGWKLLLNDDIYRRQLTLRAIKAIHLPGHNSIEGNLLKSSGFSSGDWYAIEQRLVLVELAAQLRHGQIEQALFDEALATVMGEPSTGAEEKPAPPPRSGRQAAGRSEADRAPGAIEPLE